MKFLKGIIFVFAILLVIIQLSKAENDIPSQYTKNYRKSHPDPSMNPIHRETRSGPLSNYAPYTQPKYRKHNKNISNINNYRDTSAINAQKAKGRSVSRVVEDTKTEEKKAKRKFRKYRR